ncbi:MULTISPECIES: glycosyltransferase family 2 protein [unclassified Cyanobium]|uniref:glycosyltransferase family 2 protein n=1 Tax=unclassified Cyanobium TaxID=2627006 RepID=UPI0020CD149C|nr:MULTISPECIES: glycosyltransferase family 2 protein [unclassified Cyanobium]MCP9860040.1 glycosyltransferase family 2 protein [Cyanobium sp. Cruz-8H5]MCP9867247.1 glycosyltransferase family 2 protein [Cyanobium sp. Cruz-8D1]
MSPSRTIDCLIPCFNEQESIPALLMEIARLAEEIGNSFSEPLSLGLILVNDGSTDDTQSLATHELEVLAGFDRKILINLSRNFGKEAALLAGLRQCRSEACIILDADLQDPPHLILEMINLWLNNYKIVNAVRMDRSDDLLFKRLTAKAFYKIFDRFSHLRIQFNSSDFRLLDRVAIDAILSCNESIRFSKGFFAWVGFKQANVYFKRPPRKDGATKWGGWKLWNYALDGIFSFSTSPLRIWSYLGLIVTLIAFVLGMVAMVRTLFFGVDVPGYASLFTAVTFLGGLQLVGIGVLGEYIGRVYIETKQRPQYIIESTTELE